jgi:hypothetical protein
VSRGLPIGGKAGFETLKQDKSSKRDRLVKLGAMEGVGDEIWELMSWKIRVAG